MVSAAKEDYTGRPTLFLLRQHCFTGNIISKSVVTKNDGL